MKRFLKIALFTIILFLVGIIKVNAAENIAITDVELQDKSEYVIINEEVSLDNNKITSNVVFYDEGDYVIYKLTIKNNDNQDYKIEDILDDNRSEYLSFEYDYEDGVIKAKSEKEVLLKITYVSLLPYDSELTPEHTFNATTEVNISFKLTDYVSNPSTLDRIGKQSFTVILCVLLLFAFVKLRKSKFLYVLVLGLLLIPIGTNAEREISFNITLKNDIKASVNFLSKNWKNNIAGTYTKIEFVKRATFPSDAVDVSQEEDGTIMAWIEDDTVYIASRYKIFFPVESYDLLRRPYNQPAITEINFNDRVDTTFVKYVGEMFYGNDLEELDVSSFRTGNMLSLYTMFENINGIKKLDLSNFDTSKVKDVGNLVKDCPDLEEIIIDGWDLSNVIYGNSSFLDTKNSLKTISAKNIILPPNSSYLFQSYNGNTALESLDLTGSDTSNVNDFYYLFYNQTKLKELKGIDDWDTSNVTVMNYAFYRVGSNADGGSMSLDLSNWDISKVHEMNYIFYYLGAGLDDISLTIEGWDNNDISNAPELFREIGRNAKNVNLTLKDFHLGNVGSASNLFLGLGYNAENVNIDIDGLYLEKLNSAHSMFESIGWEAGKVKISVSNVDFSKVSDVYYMADYLGGYADEVDMKFSNWKFDILTSATHVFYSAAFNANKLSFDISNWEMPNVTSANLMFRNLGGGSKDVTFKIKDFDMSSLDNASSMFKNIGKSAETLVVEGFDTLDYSSVRSMNSTFEYAFAGDTLIDLGTIDIYANDLAYAFNGTENVKLTINLHNNPTSYSQIFYGAATREGSEIIVNYTADVTDIDNIVNTKSSNSNIVKGVLIED